MKSALRRCFLALGERSYFVVWLVQVIRFVSQTVCYFRTRRGELDYPAVENRIAPDAGATLFNDHGLNFFSRLILENRYAFVIELGAFTAARSIRLAKLFPVVAVYALDVTRDFEIERTEQGITIGPNSLANIAAIACRNSGHRGLVCAHGVLAYYQLSELQHLFAKTAALSLDVAFSEPNVSLTEQSRTQSLKRTAGSYYHSFIHSLQQVGYILPDSSGQQVRDCWGRYAEERTFIFATLRHQITAPDISR